MGFGSRRPVQTVGPPLSTPAFPELSEPWAVAGSRVRAKHVAWREEAAWGRRTGDSRDLLTPCNSRHCARETGVTGVTTRRLSRFWGDRSCRRPGSVTLCLPLGPTLKVHFPSESHLSPLSHPEKNAGGEHINFAQSRRARKLRGWWGRAGLCGLIGLSVVAGRGAVAAMVGMRGRRNLRLVQQAVTGVGAPGEITP